MDAARRFSSFSLLAAGFILGACSVFPLFFASNYYSLERGDWSQLPQIITASSSERQTPIIPVEQNPPLQKQPKVVTRESSKPIPYSKINAETSPLADPGAWIILLEVNAGYYDFFKNWLYHYAKLKADLTVVVMAEDDVVEQNIRSEGLMDVHRFLQVERSKLDLAAKDHSYNTASYKKMVSARATHILQKLETGISVIYCDVDTVWKQNPIPFIAATDSADLIIQVDDHNYNGCPTYYCTGFMALVSNNVNIEFMKMWQTALQAAQLNQPVFNSILYKQSKVYHQPLPKPEFPNGREFFDQYSSDQRDQTVVVHNNYIVGHDPKKARFEKHSIWN